MLGEHTLKGTESAQTPSLELLLHQLGTGHAPPPTRPPTTRNRKHCSRGGKPCLIPALAWPGDPAPAPSSPSSPISHQGYLFSGCFYSSMFLSSSLSFVPCGLMSFYSSTLVLLSFCFRGNSLYSTDVVRRYTGSSCHTWKSKPHY